MADKNKTKIEKSNDEADTAAKPFDVTGPGKTPALATSRPLIVGHGGMAGHDPMMIEENVKESDAALSDETNSSQTDTAEIKVESNTTDITTDTTLETEAVSKTEPDKNAPESVEEENQESSQEASAEKPSGSGAVNSLMDEVDAKQADKKQKRELEERALELEKSIASKEFFVPIGVDSRHRSDQRMLWWMIVILLLAAAGLNFAIDAGVLDIGFQAVTDVL